MKTTFSIIGLGKLGCSMAAAVAKRGFEVIGVDVVPEVVECVNRGLAPVDETDLASTLSANRERLQATRDFREAVENSDLSFVIVPTPSDPRGAFSLQYAADAFREIGKALSHKDAYHNIVLTSTVLPGSIRYGLIPILEKYSQKVCGRDFGLCYSPEFIALGSIIHDFLNPDFTLVGEIDQRAGDHLESCYSLILENGAPCKRMTIENAELTKIALNTFVTTKITYANMVAELCEHLPGGDVDVVTDALGLDSRIGRKYLTGALGYGGPCFPRDNVALGFTAGVLGVKSEIPETTDRINRGLAQKILERLKPFLKADVTVAILGLAYKPFSHVIEESQGIYLAKVLAENGVRLLGYDPLATPEVRKTPEAGIIELTDLATCLNRSQIIVITTPDPIFRDLKASDFPARTPPLIVFDCWRILRKELEDKTRIRYLAVGIGSNHNDSAEKLKNQWRGLSG